MAHIFYKITNILNGKIYYGVHNNSDINYLGSGTVLATARQKYGDHNFRRDTVASGSKEEMFALERRIVTEEFVKNPTNYNIALGGCGGDLGEHINMKRRGASRSDESKQKMSLAKQGITIPSRKGNLNSSCRVSVRNKISKSVADLPKNMYCVHCNEYFTAPKYGQWHGNKCKGKNA